MTSTVLIAGASGLVGAAAVNPFLDETLRRASATGFRCSSIVRSCPRPTDGRRRKWPTGPVTTHGHAVSPYG